MLSGIGHGSSFPWPSNATGRPAIVGSSTVEMTVKGFCSATNSAQKKIVRNTLANASGFFILGSALNTAYSALLLLLRWRRSGFPRLSTSTPHESTTPSSNHPPASARTETLCLTPLGLLCPSSLPPLPSTPTRCLSRPVLVKTAARSRQEQRSKPSAHAQPHTNPIGSRGGRLPSSRCIRSTHNTPSIHELRLAGRSRYSPKTYGE